MYEHLLVALDGSETAEHVLPHAEALAEKFGSTVTLLRAVISAETLLAQSATAGPAVGEVAPPMDPTPILEAEQGAATDYLSALERRLRKKGVTVNSEHPEGDAADVIVERAQALGVSLILMTTHGRSGIGRIVFGSTADAVLRHAACPVLLVRVHEEEAEAST
jgi:nucleotide-binding universal stress UspA family protein